MDYKNPKQSGREAYRSGASRNDCLANHRTSANDIRLWIQGWDDESKKCTGIEIEPGIFSGCDQSAGDCPVCGA